jgi:hypothetical protein
MLKKPTTFGTHKFITWKMLSHKGLKVASEGLKALGPRMLSEMYNARKSTISPNKVANVCLGGDPNVTAS